MWSTTDGEVWTEEATDPAWIRRGNFGCASYDGRLWVVGGWTNVYNKTLADVWFSDDGATWEEVETTVPWSARAGIQLVAFHSHLWMLGGNHGDNVWFTTDGETWQAPEELTPFGQLQQHVARVHNDRLYVLGGTLADEVWSTADGETWTRESADGPWRWQGLGAATSHHDALFFLGGYTTSGQIDDVWFSANGTDWWWQQASPRWAARERLGAATYGGRLWIAGGTSYVDATTHTYSDVWYYEGWLECEPSLQNVPPTVTLRIDPPEGAPPLTVLFEAAAQDLNCDDLTYTWDLGDGPPFSAGSRVPHTYATTGVYGVSVTVSDGTFQAIDTGAVTVAARPGTSISIDDTGGTLALDGCIVTVPADTAPASVSFGLSEWPTLSGTAGADIDLTRFQPIGKAYHVDTPLHSDTPFSIAIPYDEKEAHGAHLGAMVRLMVRTDSRRYVAEAPSLAARYVVLPVSTARAGVATVDLHTGGTVQLVAMAQPLEVVTGTLGERQTGPDFQIVYNNAPTKISALTYSAVATEALTNAYVNLVTLKQFPGPIGKVTVVVKAMANTGEVAVDNPLVLSLASDLTAQRIRTAMAHEFFHVIQGHCTNVISGVYYFNQDAWFEEGTAEWAADEVYDEISNSYNAPSDIRFTEPLNHPAPDDAREYQTVAFWKWVEAAYPGTLRTTLTNQQLLTHSVVAGKLVETPALYDRQTVFLATLPNPDFLTFAGAALYFKDYDLNETRDGDLWHDDYLDGPRELPGMFGSPYEFDRLQVGTGDAESNKHTISYSLYQALTADVHVVTSPENVPAANYLHGKLHIAWQQASAPVDAMIIATRGSREIAVEKVRDLSVAHSDTVLPWFGTSNYKVIVILVDPRWNVPSTAQNFVDSFDVWVEGCGSYPGIVTSVDSVSGLETACKALGPGNTVLLAPGVYTLQSSLWEVEPGVDLYAGLFINGLTIAGAGADDTIISIPDLPFPMEADILTEGNAAFRNLSIIVYESTGMIVTGTGLTFCNVEFDYLNTATGGWGMWYVPFSGYGSMDFVGSILHGTSLVGSGIVVENCHGTGNVSIDIDSTIISGWRWGVELLVDLDPDCGTISIAPDCRFIKDNAEYNVLEQVCPNDGGTCTATELCP